MYYETSWDLDGFWLVFCSYRGDARNSISLWVQFRELSNSKVEEIR
ncbi:hypothetical protein G4475_09530 [Blautia wexlerae]|nr:hypothetical protein [Blautia wexlerae]RHN95907.1 hypothetical protein DW648_03360 [Ruminococcus sp. AM23-1LB]RHO13441.1 hypothetical protein DW225_16965 [Ruminococcus sp. AM18-44]RHO21174.1 hypothetical protein DW217_16845 [Ruminococcus sp. AM18-15]RHO44401.1 hypothetical protein DW141_15300 [Ruminococcus sp. AM12-48]RHQ51264.1 hypothetical protein DWY47_04550 [Ruminococcus sp. AF25-23LB]RHS65469.1 hypothetical protein DW955_01440 [Ruminococcus sp. AM45-9BH]RHS75081.1 hypothetical protei